MSTSNSAGPGHRTRRQPDGPTPYHHGDVRRVTLAGAREMLERMPAKQISLREVAREAGLSHAAPYKHFAERSGFLAALAAVCVAELIGEQRAAVEPVTDPEDRLRTLGAGYVGWGTRHPHAFQLIFDPDIDDGELTALLDEHRTLLVEAIEGMMRAGRFAGGDVATIALTLWSLVHGTTQLVILGQIDAAAVPAILRTALAGA